MHILFLSRWQPFPPNNGSKQRIYNLIKVLCTQHNLTLITFIEPGESTPSTVPAFQNLESIQYIVRKPFNPSSGRALLGFFNLKPRFVIDTYSDEMELAIQNALNDNKIDFVIASQFDMAIYRPVFRKLPALFEEMEIGVFTQRIHEAQNTLQKFRSWLTWAKHSRYLKQLLSSFQMSTVVSSQEAELTRQAFPKGSQVEILPNCVNLADYQSLHVLPDPKRLIFTGSFSYEPNYQAMRWFVENVFPKILESHPDVQLVITGDSAGKQFEGYPNILQTGMVADIRPWVAGAWISLAPILTGGGTRLKILEAMGLRSAVVSTPKGAEGLDIAHGEHLLVADQPNDFAAGVCKLLDDPGLRDHLTEKAYLRVAERYDWDGQSPYILSLIDKITLK